MLESIDISGVLWDVYKRQIILFGSYAKGTENEDSDIDIAVISDDFDDIYDCMAILMGMTWDIDARIEPHPISKEDYEKVSWLP